MNRIDSCKKQFSISIIDLKKLRKKLKEEKNKSQKHEKLNKFVRGNGWIALRYCTGS